MIQHPPAKSSQRASTLVEAVIAIGVLAVAIPLVFATLAQAGKSGMSAEAETRCIWIVPSCMSEIQASRSGRPQFFIPTKSGETFPPAGDVWTLAFSSDGKTIGKISNSQYEQGLKELNGKPVLYLAAMSASKATVNPAGISLMNVRIAVEFPAAASAVKRQKLNFHTRIP
jgi:type II secretory pathway pseudopilin PulG